MKCMVDVGVLLLAAVTVNAFNLRSEDAVKEKPFVDCPSKQASFNLFTFFLPWTPPTITKDRICCESNQLPKGCECFDIGSNSYFTNTRGKLPQCPEHLGVEFYLYTRENKDNFFMISTTDLSIPHSNFNASRKTKVLVHGFTDWAPNAWMTKTKDNILDSEDVNVILVNWHQGAIGFNFNFWIAAANTRPTAAIVANMITVLMKDYTVNPKDIHLIGHSMGGQVVGMTGKEVQRLANVKLGRISGIDPAGPGFEDYSVHVHLDKSDADFVDIMHADAVRPGLGMKHAHGHVDFFMNEADVQPGCPEKRVTFDGLLNFAPGTLDSVCSHLRAYDMYVSSVKECTFKPKGDEKDCVMGYHASPAGCSGSHFINTTTTIAPYCP